MGRRSNTVEFFNTHAHGILFSFCMSTWRWSPGHYRIAVNSFRDHDKDGNSIMEHTRFRVQKASRGEWHLFVINEMNERGMDKYVGAFKKKGDCVEYAKRNWSRFWVEGRTF